MIHLKSLRLTPTISLITCIQPVLISYPSTNITNSWSSVNLQTNFQRQSKIKDIIFQEHPIYLSRQCCFQLSSELVKECVYQIDLYQQVMAQEEQVAFDNWEEEAQEVIQQVEAPTAAEEKAVTQEQIEKQETVSEKKEPIDPKKLLQDRIDTYKSIDQTKFEDYFQSARLASNNQEMKANTQVLKNDKDFALFAKKVAKVFTDRCEQDDLDNLEEDNILTFFEENFLLIYNQFPWKHMAGVHDKLKIVKKQKKQQQLHAKKRVKKEKIREKQGAQLKGDTPKYEDTKVEDDIFGGAVLVNSKQVEEELKNKPIEKVEAPKKVEEQDDDDFM